MAPLKPIKVELVSLKLLPHLEAICSECKTDILLLFPPEAWRIQCAWQWRSSTAEHASPRKSLSPPTQTWEGIKFRWTARVLLKDSRQINWLARSIHNVKQYPRILRSSVPSEGGQLLSFTPAQRLQQVWVCHQLCLLHSSAGPPL